MPVFQIPVYVSKGGRPDLGAISMHWQRTIKNCWQQEAKRRPSFSELLPALIKIRKRMQQSTLSRDRSAKKSRSTEIERTSSGSDLSGSLPSLLGTNTISPNKDTGSPLDLRQFYDEMRLGAHNLPPLEVSDRRKFFATFRRSFLGSQAVDWTCSRCGVNRLTAVVLLQEMMDRKMIVDARRCAVTFEDSNCLYQFVDLPAVHQMDQADKKIGLYQKLGEILARPSILEAFASTLAGLREIQDQPAYLKTCMRLVRGRGRDSVGRFVHTVCLGILTNPNVLVANLMTAGCAISWVFSIYVNEKLSRSLFRELLVPIVKTLLSYKAKATKTIPKIVEMLEAHVADFLEANKPAISTIFSPFRPHLLEHGCPEDFWFTLLLWALKKSIGRLLYHPERLGVKLGPGQREEIVLLGRAFNERVRVLAHPDSQATRRATRLFQVADQITGTPVMMFGVGGLHRQLNSIASNANKLLVDTCDVERELDLSVDILASALPQMLLELNHIGKPELAAELQAVFAEVTATTLGSKLELGPAEAPTDKHADFHVALGATVPYYDWLGRALPASAFTVLVFLRGDWCRHDMAYAQDWSAAAGELIQRGGQLTLVSAISPLKMANLPNNWLLRNMTCQGEPSNHVALKLGLPIVERSGFPNGMPLPAVVVLDRKKNLLYHWTTVPVKKNLFGAVGRPSPQDVLKAVAPN